MTMDGGLMLAGVCAVVLGVALFATGARGHQAQKDVDKLKESLKVAEDQKRNLRVEIGPSGAVTASGELTVSEMRDLLGTLGASSVPSEAERSALAQARWPPALWVSPRLLREMRDPSCEEIKFDQPWARDALTLTVAPTPTGGSPGHRYFMATQTTLHTGGIPDVRDTTQFYESEWSETAVTSLKRNPSTKKWEPGSDSTYILERK